VGMWVCGYASKVLSCEQSAAICNQAHSHGFDVDHAAEMKGWQACPH